MQGTGALHYFKIHKKKLPFWKTGIAQNTLWSSIFFSPDSDFVIAHTFFNSIIDRCF